MVFNSASPSVKGVSLQWMWEGQKLQDPFAVEIKPTQKIFGSASSTKSNRVISSLPSNSEHCELWLHRDSLPNILSAFDEHFPPLSVRRNFGAPRSATNIEHAQRKVEERLSASPGCGSQPTEWSHRLSPRRIVPHASSVFQLISRCHCKSIASMSMHCFQFYLAV